MRPALVRVRDLGQSRPLPRSRPTFVRVRDLILAMVGIAAVAIIGCKSSPSSKVVRTTLGEALPESQWNSQELVHDLEATVLENYLQLSLGNLQGYADSVAHDREIILVGVSPGTLVVGQNPPGLTAERQPFRDRRQCMADSMPDELCLRLLPKKLDVHVYGDGSVGWVNDELSYRVPHQGREAVIPVRMSAVFVRDVDRWILVMEHMSYALPRVDILAMAERGLLVAPQPMGTHLGDRGRGRLITRLVDKQHNADDKAIQRHARAMHSKSAQENEADLPDRAFMHWLPHPRAEFRAAAAHTAPSLAQSYGPGTRVELGDHRVWVAANQRVAWMVANLTVTSPRPDGRELAIRMRGTYVFAFDSVGWNLVQMHVSVPITEAQLAERFFGRGLPDEPSPAPGEQAGRRKL